MVEIFRSQDFNVALSAYKTWVDRSIKFGFYSSSVGFAFNRYGSWSILIVGELNERYQGTLPF